MTDGAAVAKNIGETLYDKIEGRIQTEEENEKHHIALSSPLCLSLGLLLRLPAVLLLSLRLAIGRSSVSLLSLLLLCLLLGLVRCPGCDVKTAIDDAGDGHDFRTQLLLDAVKIEAVLIRDEIDGNTEMTKSTATANSVEVGLGVLGEIEVDDDIDSLDIDTTRQEV